MSPIELVYIVANTKFQMFKYQIFVVTTTGVGRGKLNNTIKFADLIPVYYYEHSFVEKMILKSCRII